MKKVTVLFGILVSFIFSSSFALSIEVTKDVHNVTYTYSSDIEGFDLKIESMNISPTTVTVYNESEKVLSCNLEGKNIVIPAVQFIGISPFPSAKFRWLRCTEATIYIGDLDMSADKEQIGRFLHYENVQVSFFKRQSSEDNLVSVTFKAGNSSDFQYCLIGETHVQIPKGTSMSLWLSESFVAENEIECT